ncbi:MAG: branched-chain amino acid aminotransferase [Chitinophagaceae bacterium]|jgi:branched-chain amino acid aminotransferase
MTTTAGITVSKAETSKLNSLELENIPFGKYFSDHMLEADYENGEWKVAEIKPYQPLLVSPSNAAWHYGQSIFEGIKAFKHENGDAFIFRPHDNFKRFNISAERMQMPHVPEEIFMEGMRKLIELDKSWIPQRKDHSLYIRPFMIATDEVIGVRPSENYKFMIILSPAGPYYNTPIKIYVEEQYVRAVPGGVGYAKAAGNYAGAMYPTAQARAKGYDQVLWTDALEHKYLQEFGVMNGFVIIGNTAITPDLKEGTILAGVTRDSVMQLLKDMGLTVEERHISIDEVIEAHKAGTLKEVFGTGTAATISYVKELRYKDYQMFFDTENYTISTEVKRRLTDIREGKEADVYEWLYKI